MPASKASTSLGSSSTALNAGKNELPARYNDSKNVLSTAGDHAEQVSNEEEFSQSAEKLAKALPDNFGDVVHRKPKKQPAGTSSAVAHSSSKPKAKTTSVQESTYYNGSRYNSNKWPFPRPVSDRLSFVKEVLQVHVKDPVLRKWLVDEVVEVFRTKVKSDQQREMWKMLKDQLDELNLELQKQLKTAFPEWYLTRAKIQVMMEEETKCRLALRADAVKQKEKRATEHAAMKAVEQVKIDQRRQKADHQQSVLNQINKHMEFQGMIQDARQKLSDLRHNDIEKKIRAQCTKYLLNNLLTTVKVKDPNRFARALLKDKSQRSTGLPKNFGKTNSTKSAAVDSFSDEFMLDLLEEELKNVEEKDKEALQKENERIVKLLEETGEYETRLGAAEAKVEDASAAVKEQDKILAAHAATIEQHQATLRGLQEDLKTHQEDAAFQEAERKKRSVADARRYVQEMWDRDATSQYEQWSPVSKSIKITKKKTFFADLFDSKPAPKRKQAGSRPPGRPPGSKKKKKDGGGKKALLTSMEELDAFMEEGFDDADNENSLFAGSNNFIDTQTPALVGGQTVFDRDHVQLSKSTDNSLKRGDQQSSSGFPFPPAKKAKIAAKEVDEEEIVDEEDDLLRDDVKKTTSKAKKPKSGTTAAASVHGLKVKPYRTKEEKAQHKAEKAARKEERRARREKRATKRERKAQQQGGGNGEDSSTALEQQLQPAKEKDVGQEDAIDKEPEEEPKDAF
ncbi:unnamed protein product, partial [Amoebophrya sp. A120]|eukprot:GSA120T00003330001.1